MSVLLSNAPASTPFGGDVSREIDSRVQNGEFDSFIYVVPTRRKANFLRREWLRKTSAHAAPAIPVYTLGDLAVFLAQSSLIPRFAIGEEIQYVLLERAARRARLGYFTKRRATLPEGTMRTILNTILKMKESGVTLAHLRQTLAAQHSAGENNRRKSADILALFEGYESQIHETFRDAPDVLRELNEKIEERGVNDVFNTAFPHWQSVRSQPIIHIEGFSEFRPPECRLLASLSTLQGTIVSLSLDYAAGNNALFGHLEEHITRLRTNGFRFGSTSEPVENGWRGVLRKKIFADDLAAKHSAKNVTTLRADSREREVETITRIIKRIAREKPNRDLSRICVAVRQPDNYISLFTEAFNDAGIPVNITERFPLSQAGIAVAFIGLLDLQLHNFRLRDVARVFSSPYFTLRNAYRRNEPIDGSNLVAVGERLRIAGGIEIWRERIKHRLTYLHSADESDDISLEDIESEIAASTRALHDIEALHKIMQELSVSGAPEDYRSRFDLFFRNAETQKNVFAGWFHNPGELFESQERENRAYAMLRELIQSVCEALATENNSRDEKGGVPQMKSAVMFNDFARMLRAAVTHARFNIRQEFGKGVLLTAPEETRGLDIDVMFIAGLVEGEFPLPYSPEIFLPDTYQTSRTRHAQDERFLFYQAASNWKERLYLSTPARDGGEKDLVPSSFLDEILRHFDCAEYREEQHTLYSKKQYWRAVGDSYARQNGGLDAGLNEHTPFHPIHSKIKTGVIAELSRHKTHEFPEYEGFLSNLTDSQNTRLSRYRTAVFSASRLTAYALCPFRFFTEHVLRVTSPFMPEDGLSPMERGALLHRILFKYYAGIRERREKFPQDINDDGLPAAKKALRDLAQSEITKLGVEHPFWKLDIERYFGLESPVSILDNFIDAEHKLKELRVRPSFFEVSFGLRDAGSGQSDGLLSRDAPVLFGEWALRGKIDRIDTDASIDANSQSWTIIDYKTGSLPAKSDIINGLNLQLPLYMRVAETLAATQTEIAAGVYYEVKSQSREWKQNLYIADKTRESIAFAKTRAHVSASQSDMNEIIDGAVMHANSYIAGMVSGRFPLAQPQNRQRACRSCQYMNTCRVRDDVVSPPELRETFS